jgi:hypothetical protein
MLAEKHITVIDRPIDGDDIQRANATFAAARPVRRK